MTRVTELPCCFPNPQQPSPLYYEPTELTTSLWFPIRKNSECDELFIAPMAEGGDYPKPAPRFR